MGKPVAYVILRVLKVQPYVGDRRKEDMGIAKEMVLVSNNLRSARDSMPVASDSQFGEARCERNQLFKGGAIRR